MKFIPSQNGALTNVGFAMATIDAFLSHMDEGRIDDICADTGSQKTHRKGEGGGTWNQVFAEAAERPTLSPEEKLLIALLMNAIEDSFRLTPVTGTEYYHKEFYLTRYERNAKRWLRGETGSGRNRDDNSEVECYTAAECFEAAGIDYRKALAKLESAWLKHRQTGESVVQRTRRAASGMDKMRVTVNE